MDELVPETWLEAEPTRRDKERQAMSAVAPDLRWCEEDQAGGWEGVVPIWPFNRTIPPHLEDFLYGRRLKVRIEYLESFPMVEPKFLPLEPEPEIRHRTDARWHVLGDGALCLFQDASDWTGGETAADLIPKAAGWFLEFLLMQDGVIDQMTEEGIATDPSFDHLFVPPSTGDESQRGESFA